MFQASERALICCAAIEDLSCIASGAKEKTDWLLASHEHAFSDALLHIIPYLGRCNTFMVPARCKLDDYAVLGFNDLLQI